MILYCAADPNYFNNYFELWATQCNKFYPNHLKIVALYKPDDNTKSKCKEYNVTYRDITNYFVDNPERNHFYLLRWLFLPYDMNENILETQINCLPIKTQIFPDIDIEQYRISRLKRGFLGGVSAAVFTPAGAKRVVEQAKKMLSHPPKNDHEMNMWQINNLKHEFVKSEQQFKIINKKIDDETCWITAGTSQHYTVEQKLEILKAYIK